MLTGPLIIGSSLLTMLFSRLIHQGSGSHAIGQNFRLYQAHQEELKEAL